MFDDLGVRPLGWAYDTFVWFTLARAMGVKVIFTSIGAGPIHNKMSRALMKSAATSTTYCSYRDGISKSFMANLGLDVSRFPVTADIAFGLPSPPLIPRSESSLTFGIGLMTYYN